MVAHRKRPAHWLLAALLILVTGIGVAAGPTLWRFVTLDHVEIRRDDGTRHIFFLKRFGPYQGEQHGPIEVWSGTIKILEGQFDDGRPTGIWREWSPDGQLISRKNMDLPVDVPLDAAPARPGLRVPE